jgi:hypothetical protein
VENSFAYRSLGTKAVKGRNVIEILLKNSLRPAKTMPPVYV